MAAQPIDRAAQKNTDYKNAAVQNVSTAPFFVANLGQFIGVSRPLDQAFLCKPKARRDWIKQFQECPPRWSVRSRAHGCDQQGLRSSAYRARSRRSSSSYRALCAG